MIFVLLSQYLFFLSLQVNGTLRKFHLPSIVTSIPSRTRFHRDSFQRDSFHRDLIAAHLIQTKQKSFSNAQTKREKANVIERVSTEKGKDQRYVFPLCLRRIGLRASNQMYTLCFFTYIWSLGAFYYFP